MLKVTYVGFNGYGQCPKEEEVDRRKVIGEWTEFCVKGGVGVSCSFRTFAILAEKHLLVRGLIGDEYEDNCKRFELPAFPEAFLVTDDYAIVSEGCELWKTGFDGRWSRMDVSCQSDDEVAKKLRKGTTRVVKMCYIHHQHQILLLVDDGSIWRLHQNNLSILFRPTLDKAVDVSCGLEHALILTESGCVLSFGMGSRGQLGHGDLTPSPEPMQVLALGGLKVVKIASGGWHSCAVTDSNDLYVWGWNNCGQLSEIRDEEGNERGVVPIPCVVDIDADEEVSVIDVACGTRHTIVMTGSGELFSVGWNDYGQLGIKDGDMKKSNRFVKADLAASSGRQRKIACGPWCSIAFEHVPNLNDSPVP